MDNQRQTPAEQVAAEVRRRIAAEEERDRAQYEEERVALTGSEEPLDYEEEGEPTKPVGGPSLADLEEPPCPTG